MRLISLFLSLALHAAVIAAGFYSSMGSSLHIDLGKRIYTVDLVTLAPSSPKPSPPASAAVQQPAVVPKQAPTKAVPPKVVSTPTVSRPKPAPKKAVAISPQKTPKTKKRVAKTPAKKTPPKLSSQQILAQALKGVQSEVAGQERQDKKDLAKELAGLKKQVGPQSRGSGGGAGQGTGLMQVYGQLAESVVKKHWRFPRVGGPDLVAQVEVMIDPSGKVLGSKILRSSGRTDFDASAQRAIQEAEELPKPPSPDIRRLIINFNLNELGD